MGKKILIGLMVISFLIILPGAAKAGFFNDGRWYMDSSWWELCTGVSGRGNLIDQNDRLEWNTDASWADGYDSFRLYGSKWTFLLNDDFEFNVGFHYDHTGYFKTDKGGVGMELVWFDDPDAIEPSHIFGISAENWMWMQNDNLKNKNVFWTGEETPSSEIESWWRRTSTDGMLYARYEADKDRLQLQAIETGSDDSVGGIEFNGLKSELGLNELRLSFGGWSEGAGLDSGDAYLQNFNVVKGTMTPEPVSSILFLIGGLSLAAARLRRR